MMKVLKRLRGKKITEAKYWEDDEGEVCLELNFSDETFFCLDVKPPHNLSSKLYLDGKAWSNSKTFKPLKEYK